MLSRPAGPWSRSPLRPRAFTLIEVLVVAAILALLAAVLLPSLKRGRDQGRKAVCGSNLHGLMGAMHMYVNDHRGWTHKSPNNGLWDNAWQNPPVVKMYKPNDSNAYWGIAYCRYAKNKSIFACPAVVRVDDWPENNWGLPYQRFFRFCAYGLNGFIANAHGDDAHTGLYQAGMQLDRDFRFPATTIAFQDHIEQRLEQPIGPDSDSFCLTPAQGTNLTQWRFGWRKTEFPSAVDECFRHLSRSNTVWLDGHVSDIRKTDGQDVPVAWYTGGRRVP